MNAVPAKMQVATATVTDRRVVVIAGLKAAGKSTLIEEMLNGRRPALGRLIGLHVASEWRVARAADLCDEPAKGARRNGRRNGAERNRPGPWQDGTPEERFAAALRAAAEARLGASQLPPEPQDGTQRPLAIAPKPPARERLILHYDLLRRFLPEPPSAAGFAADPVLRTVLDGARASVVTVRVAHAVLRKRVFARRLRRARGLLKPRNWLRLKRLAQVRAFYRDVEAIERCHAAWSAFCSAHDMKEVVLDVTPKRAGSREAAVD